MTRTLLLTGATGYVGARLLAALEGGGERVRCLARRPENLTGRTAAGTEVVRGDVLDPASLAAAMAGVDTAFYLVHSMGASGDFEAADRLGAENFARAARTAGVRRLVYLGGLGAPDESLSAHLRSRQEVGALLRASGVPVIELRASIVIGAGSLSFEMVRALVERLPVMITPRWVATLAQPIAISDLIAYLQASLDFPGVESRVFEIGGAERVSYGGIMREYARQRGLRRVMLRVPFLSPRLSSLWLGLVTPLYARVGRKLVDSMRHATVVMDDAALRAFEVRPVGLARAIELALAEEQHGFLRPRWSDSLSAAGPVREWGGVRFGNRLVDARLCHVAAAPARAFAPVRRIGGATGWYHANFLWRARGALDLLAGGIGLRRGRAHPDRLRVGDVVDCWRVEAFESDHRLRLTAEMRLPGRAWLEFEVEPEGDGSRLRQTASFDPIGLFGLFYWYSVWPLHQYVFAGMLRALARAAESGRPSGRSG
ncbi:MAG: SDR family oxidoreductase [Planctomycetota bacterium]